MALSSKELSIIIKARDETKAGFASATKGAGSMAASFGRGALVVGAAAVAVAGGAVELAKIGEASLVADKRIAQINKSMGLFGPQTQAVTDRLLKYADTTARQVGIDDDVIKATQAKLLTFKELAGSADVLGGKFDRATQAAIDLAAAGFGDAESNATQLGKALNDPIKGVTALARSGITFTEVEKKKMAALVKSGQIMQAQEIMLKAIETQVGGTAKATATASAKMQVAWDETVESLGVKLLPLFEKLSAWFLEKGLPAIEKFIEGIDFDAVGATLAGLWGGIKAVWDSLVVAGKWVSDTWKAIQPTLAAVWAVLKPIFDQIGATIGGTFKAAWDDLVATWKEIEPAIRPLFPVLKQLIIPALVALTFPLIIVVAAVVAVIAVFAAVVRVFAAVARAAATLGKALSTPFTTARDVVRAAIDAVVGFIAKLPGRAQAALQNLVRLIRGPIDQALALLRKLNPFARSSPSLVDNVTAGVAQIARAYGGLSGMSIAAPSIGGLSMPSSAGGSRAGAVGVSTGQPPAEIRIYLDGRELNRAIGKVAVASGRSGVR